MGRNAGIIGKNSAANGEALLGMANLADKFLNRVGTSAGLGYLFAQSVAAETGGTLTTYTGGPDLTATLAAYEGSTSGNVLFLPAGNYTTTGDSTTYSQAIFPRGYYAVIGSDPSDTIIVRTDVNQAPRSDGNITTWDSNGSGAGTNLLKLTAGYLTLKTKTYSATNYENSVFHGLSTYLGYVYLKNICLNRGGSALSMLYDNSADTDPIKLINCSIGNTGTLYGNYAGSLTQKTATNCLFEPNITENTHWGTFTSTTTNAGAIFSEDENGFLTYDTGAYSTVGHEYGKSDTSFVEP